MKSRNEELKNVLKSFISPFLLDDMLKVANQQDISLRYFIEDTMQSEVNKHLKGDKEILRRGLNHVNDTLVTLYELTNDNNFKNDDTKKLINKFTQQRNDILKQLGVMTNE